MKKIILCSLILFCGFTLGQETDPANRFLVKEISKMQISNSEQRDLLTKTLDSIQKVTPDQDLRKQIADQIDKFNGMKFIDMRSIGLGSLSKADKKGWYFRHDKFKEITYVTKRSLVSNKTRLYIGVRDNNQMFLRFRNDYHGSYWVFADKITFMIDGKKYSYIPNASGTDVSTSADVTEYFDTAVDESLYEILQKIAESTSDVEFQFTGKSSATSRITKNQKQGIKETLDFFERLKAE